MNQTIIIVGAGLAGLSAALTAAEKEYQVVLLSSMPSERAQSVMAEGGINASLNTKGESDSTEEHYRDTMEAGAWLADPNAVAGLVEAAPGIVRHLAALGVLFNLDDKGEIDLRNFGGQKKKRTAFAMSSTGKQVMTALIQEVRRYEAQGLIMRHCDHAFVSLIMNGENKCVGCVALHNRTQEMLSFRGDAVILAAGGMNGLFGNTTGSLQNTGTVTAELFRLGVPLANGEFIQYHPTTAEFSGKHLLISEAARGEGGRLFIYRAGQPYYFMEEKYPEMGNLMPRDIVSREIRNICSSPDGSEKVYLDLTELPADVMEKKLGDLAEDCKIYLHTDLRKKPIPVTPGIHYFMGGIQVDEWHRTVFPNLYAAGECCCQYHGANRLGGNSMLGAIYGGAVAAGSAIQEMSAECSVLEFEICRGQAMNDIWQRIEALRSGARHIPLPSLWLQLHRILNNSLGIVRDEALLQSGLDALDLLITEKVAGNYDDTCGLYENLNMGSLYLLGKATLMSAYNRRESRGAHYRSDYPKRNDEAFRKTTVARYDGGRISVGLEDIPERRCTP